jgi:hypothetical protein
MIRRYLRVLPSAASLVAGAILFVPHLKLPNPGGATQLHATLSEWKIELSRQTLAGGPVSVAVENTGSIPHQLEIEGNGIEQRTELIQPGSTATLRLNLKPGSYEVYCPVGDDSHKKLGMETHLTVAGDSSVGRTKSQAISVSGGGTVIQILPGPFPFADSLRAVLSAFGEERASLEAQAQSGPYSNNVTPIRGTFTLTAWDEGAAGDSVKGTAKFTTKDAAHWKLVLDRVQTKDVPHHPRFGGVIMGLYYHGITTVHTPLVPTIRSAVALWSIGHLYRNDSLVTADAQVHVMLLSRTRAEKNFALSCWDCSKNKIDELQLQVTPAKGEPPFPAPGGFLFVNWERSSGRELAMSN